jgi:putative transposase
VIIRGIERRDIVDDDKDRENFISRLGQLAAETETGCKSLEAGRLRSER